MKEIIKRLFAESIEAKQKTIETQLGNIEEAAQIIINSLKQGQKILICGNGGSAADSQHFATELVSRFEKDRAALPAIALSTDTSGLTATGNDFGFESVFSRQVEALGNKNDVFIGFSTSGNSKNIIKAIQVANEKEMKIISFLGRDGGKINNMNTSCNIIIPNQVTARIQECHETIYHILCKLIEDSLF
jgi:D-sedoheptulose 7-phosphate isomerase